MFDESEPPSPSSALVALAPLDPEWQPILHVSNQVVLYNPTSHALSVRIRSRSPSPSLTRRHVVGRCPYCNRFLPTDLHGEHEVDDDTDGEFLHDGHGIPRSRATNYFQLLEIANETASRPATPSTSTSRASRNIGGSASNASAGSGAFRADNMAEGYFKAFFKEEGKLGMGANGSVFLCQVRVTDATDWFRAQHFMPFNDSLIVLFVLRCASEMTIHELSGLRCECWTLAPLQSYSYV